MSTSSRDTCERCGSEIIHGYCNCFALFLKMPKKRKEATAEVVEKKRRQKDPQWKRRQRRKPKRR